MQLAKRGFGKISGVAPELARFAFLIGKWRFDAKVKLAGGEVITFRGTWIGRYILEGHAIADEYRMVDASGKLIVLGLNLRAYDAAKKMWNIKWLNGLTGTWADLTPAELGGVTYTGPSSLSYIFNETSPMDAAHTYSRVTYTNDAKNRFTWRGEKSSDRKAWTEFMVVECRRAKR